MSHYTRPLKFLSYLGWCILGVLGQVLDGQKQPVPLDTERLQDGETYFYQPENTGDIFKYAIDLAVINPRSEYNSSQSTAKNPDFLANLLQRDGACLFTGINIGLNGTHIIPHSKGDDCLKLIVEDRPYDDVEVDLTSLDDIRNGMLTINPINTIFDTRQAVVIKSSKTPNHILDTDDVAPRCGRELEEDTSYPSDARYTFQYLQQENRKSNLRIMPDNNDAAFPTTPSITLPKPAAFLLNYNFGAAAVRLWGKNKMVFENREEIQRPKIRVSNMAPKRTPGKENRERFVTKRRKLDEQGGQGEVGPSRAPQDAQNTATTQEWDEDDIMLFFWGNTKAARERRERKEQNIKESVKKWRSTVAAE
ncbi:hypothetical protein Clacol_000834 [Clathrus columnatus]|uniref:HNH nuclease domain-containing protein n=1 Tax=Clathrus columnatus TaxID=1419009 RepID=A0AAV5A414_9AGAM|nr:hypothetical protein Clacol_000834 [Clathrus columnatus]